MRRLTSERKNMVQQLFAATVIEHNNKYYATITKVKDLPVEEPSIGEKIFSMMEKIFPNGLDDFKKRVREECERRKIANVIVA